MPFSRLSVSSRPVEEQALFNPAFLALVMRRAAEEHVHRGGGRLLPVMLAYLVAPLALHGPTRRQLPSHVTTQMGEWIRNHPDASAGLDVRAVAQLPATERAALLRRARETAGRLAQRRGLEVSVFLR